MQCVRTLPRLGLVTALGVAALAPTARADQGGVGSWLPGTFASLAAVPGTPGLQFAVAYYHSSIKGGGDTVFRLGSRLVVGLRGDADLAFLTAGYIFATPVLGGQFSFSVSQAVGRLGAGISGTVTGPLGNTISGSLEQASTSYSDIFPMASLKWNFGVHNVMTYLWGVIPVGDYDPGRIANVGLGHGAFDGGVGYTYFDPHKGHEFSAVAGLTYNFINPDTQYQNGVTFHLDWAASQFITKQLHIGLVGYLYNQIGCDSGDGATLGCFRSRVAGIGPQAGYIIPMGEWQGYLNLKGYWEFAHQNRPEGWNLMLTFAITQAAPHPAPAPPTRTPAIWK